MLLHTHTHTDTLLAQVAELVDALDLKSSSQLRLYRFDSGPGHNQKPAAGWFRCLKEKVERRKEKVQDGLA